MWYDHNCDFRVVVWCGGDKGISLSIITSIHIHTYFGRIRCDLGVPPQNETQKNKNRRNIRQNLGPASANYGLHCGMFYWNSLHIQERRDHNDSFFVTQINLGFQFILLSNPLSLSPSLSHIPLSLLKQVVSTCQLEEPSLDLKDPTSFVQFWVQGPFPLCVRG